MNGEAYRRIPLWKDVPVEEWESYGWQMRNRLTGICSHRRRGAQLCQSAELESAFAADSHFVSPFA